MTQFILTLGIRFSYRFILLMRGRKNETVVEKRVMIIGAGEAGQMILRDIKNTKELNKKVYCFIDDNKNKWGRYIDNIPVFGGRDRILEAVKKFSIEKIFLAAETESWKLLRSFLSRKYMWQFQAPNQRIREIFFVYATKPPAS